MSREYPDWVNPWKAAEGNRIFRGTIALAKMERLIPLLADAEGEASFEAGFTRDKLGFTTIRLEVRADLPLVCQASLERFKLPVERNSLLAVVTSISDQDDLPGHYEATWVESGQLVFLELVQDELILGVPQVPREPGVGSVLYSTDPDEAPDEGDDQQNNPFAALGDLMRNEQDNSETD
jgi:uncharacterized protein